MKRLSNIILLFAMTLWANAQTIYLCKGGDYTTATISQGMEIDLSAGYDSITFTKPQIAPVVRISFDGTAATAAVPSFVQGVTATVSGADVVINSTNDTEEITYIASGTSANGSLTINGIYKLTLVLNGLDLTSAKGAAIDIQCGKRTNLVLSEGTTNSLADAASGSQKACLYSKGHVEVSGSGTLIVTGNANHAIATKEYFQMKRTAGTVNIAKAANDAIHAGQYFQMNGGTVNITETTASDGIQAEITNDPTDENNGEVIIKGGTLNITVTGEDAKGIKADSDVTISGGTFSINANGKGSRGIQTSGNMTVGEEDNATSITVNANGTRCTCGEEHRCWGIKVGGNLTVNAGKITVSPKAGTKAKGIQYGGTYTKNGGTVSPTPEQDKP